ncbi:cystathionine gamma-lyase [Halogeometricum pallidum JCM 14848]|uniref:Cystathionine gamma-lyase n=1 Tax=Halogeometricum pallidum JCM 14848 TaxID=1227487 RepID=M0DD15_HALPD|nr:PLP-dependent aspartate aminotransferase family protein [Halogeometricum pallidum]ELZ32627.1 cystathionine gamma-lyase [Halogeometricum pallidum JCM 14848]
MTEEHDADLTEASFSTKAVHGDRSKSKQNAEFGDLIPPIHHSSTFVRDEIESPRNEFVYSRNRNPTRDELAQRIATLEQAENGLALSSGMAAIATVGWALLRPGDHVVTLNSLYGGTRNLFGDLLTEFDIDIDYLDPASPDDLVSAVRDETALIWVESPTNPLMKLCDIETIAEATAESDAVLAVDNTFMSPYFQQPLSLGADVVVHSTTKYVNGHSDVVGGAIVTDDADLHDRFHHVQKYGTGAIQSPHDSYLVTRGMKTLPQRMETHERNAQALAEFLEQHESVSSVHYPGLPSHPQHELATSQMSGHGGMLSFELDGDRDAVKHVLEGLNHFALTASLGGVESLIAHAETMTHAEVSEQVRSEMGISDTLIRISTGIEDAEDLIADLRTQLDSI